MLNCWFCVVISRWSFSQIWAIKFLVVWVFGYIVVRPAGDKDNCNRSTWERKNSEDLQWRRKADSSRYNNSRWSLNSIHWAEGKVAEFFEHEASEILKQLKKKTSSASAGREWHTLGKLLISLRFVHGQVGGWLQTHTCTSCTIMWNIKPTIHEATFVAGDTYKHYSSWVLRMEISNATFYKLLENRPPVFFQATCRMYYAIFHAQHARTIKPLMWLL